jgi:anti-sigma B factor antagonist
MALSGPGFSAIIESADGAIVITLLGELDLGVAPELSQMLDEVPAGEPVEIVLDFSDLSFIDSSGVAALITAQKTLSERGQHLSIRSPRPTALRLLEITGLVEFLHVGPAGPERDSPGPTG